MSLMKKAIGGSIHRIREFELEKVNLADEFDILQIVGEGWFGKILLTEHRSTQTEMVLKALPKAYTSITDFYREFHYGLHLSAHRNIITTYDVAFETAGFYIFSQEYAPLGDLTSNVTETGLGELHAKRVARQLAAAVHHIHSRELVHRDIKLDNILVFRSDFSRIKLCDFGETRRINTIVRRHNEWLPYSPPEVLQIDTDETYKALTSHDVWQFGIVLFVCLTGCIPWQKAAMDDRRYTRYLNWHNATLNIAKKPKLFQLISSRAQRMFKRLLEPKLEKRPISVLEVNKYLEDRWLAKLGAEKAMTGGAEERDELSPSMYSFHSSLEEKNQLLFTLTQYGIETTVDRTRKKDRIREWIESSAIAEENEEESEGEEAAERLNGNSEVEEEEVNMKGRHFPERRPSSRAIESSSSKASSKKNSSLTRARENRGGEESEEKKNGVASGKARRAQTILTSNHRAARTLKHMERRNPFAPQVAQERHAVARFGSFPNGDPNLAISSERSAIVSENAAKLAELEKEQMLIRSAGSIHDRVGNPGINQPIAMGLVERRDSTRNSPIKKVPGSEDSGHENGSLVRNEQERSSVPREQTNVKILDQRAPNESFVYENQPSLKNPQAPTRKHRAQTAPFPKLAPGQSPQTDIFQGEVFPSRSLPVIPLSVAAQSATETTSIVPTSIPNHVNNNANNYNNNNNNGSLNNQNNPLTMTVASHLVMQSFNTLQAMNTVPKTMTSDKQSTRNREPTGVAREQPPNIYPYGKDAYEHYGASQRGASVTRHDLPRQSSTGSGSRSVSN
ncbi:putative serine/threonine-protein kinase YPL150W [Venturia canescens]|uniref:putative serine/threonine-protein kinase YPL150W n=1 Tax=Venturia canescens TaxID=32260 RepID=UPI001C9C0EA2|nr:putative serine/threonine-protein kinase YPL150W [Venturia canescens]XP_043283936.1 putative serine/threonine-protein kinase YPL150W [Venturia canescens]XP_043283937.1 putative serine/threonine-protein kinase YPL150W [Venturia canescens]